MSAETKQAILIVDGQAVTRQIMSDLLRQAGYVVEEAESRDQCLAILRRHVPALAILNATSPDAFDLCRQLKTQFNVPVLMLSPQDDALIECAFAAGADDWLMDTPPAALLHKRVQHLLAPQPQNQLRAQQQIEKTLYYIAQGSWGLDSEDFLRALTIYLGKALDVAYVLIGEITDDKEAIQTVTMYAHGEIVSNLRYEIRDTPCENVFANKLCCYEHDIQALFPFDAMLKDFEIDSYIGIPLWSSKGQPIAILSIMDNKPLEQVQLTASMLQLVAVRAARELERRHSEKALREAEQFARSTLDGLSDHIAIVDHSGTVLAVNKAWRDFAYVNGAILDRVTEGANYLDVCDASARNGSQDAAAVARAMRAILDGSKDSFEYEYPCHTPNEKRWFTVRMTHFPGEGLPRVIVAHHNITILKQFEQALRNSEARYQSVISSMAEGVVVRYADGSYYTCNASAERILGLTADQLRGDTPFDPNWYTIHEDGSPFPMDTHPLRKTLNTGVPQYQVIMGIYKPDDTLTWVSINTEPLFRTGETQPYAVVASFSDITGRKNAEDALRLSEERYRLISELISDYAFAFRVREDGSLEWEWNTDSFQLITGYTQEIAEGKGRKLYHPDDRERVNQDIEDVIRTKQPNVGEYRIVTAQGETKWVQVYRQPTVDAHGRVVHMYAVTCDITSEKQAEEALVEQKRLEAVLAKERELNAFRTNLMRTLSHEFRTPLAIISTACDLLEHYIERLTPAQRQEKIVGIRNQIDRLSEMMDDISIIAQNTLQRSSARLALVNVEEICQHTVQEVHQSVGSHHQMMFEADGSITYALLDKRLLERILSNLLTNAVKYSHEGTEIITRLWREGNTVILEVHDQGMGMSEQDQQYAFEPFYRSIAANNIIGTGLGLSIVRECAALLQGTVHLKSTLGAGSTFTVRLPYRQ